MRLKLKLGLGWVCAVLLQGAVAAPPAAEAFFKDADIVEATLSPSGTRLAITTTLGVGRAGLAILDMTPGAKLNRIVQFRDGDVEDVYWVNDERLVFGVVDYSEGSGQPNGAPGLFAVNPDGSDMLRLVRRQAACFHREGPHCRSCAGMEPSPAAGASAGGGEGQ